MNRSDENFPVNPRAVRFGRGVLAFIGATIFGVATIFSFYNPRAELMFTASCMFSGLLILILAFALPSEAAAKLGFWAPGILPSDVED